MFRQISILVFLIAANSVMSVAQNVTTELSLSDYLKGTKMNSSEFVDVLSPAFFLSRQSFQVCDKKTGELYGLNNRDEFGTEITLGVKVRGGYVLTDKALHPWEYNEKFGNYKDGYSPVLFRSEYSEAGEKTRYDSLDIAQNNVNELLPSTCYLVKSDCLGGKGLNVDSTEGTKDGWVVWAVVDDNADLNTTARLTLICNPHKLEVRKDGRADVEAPEGKKVLGGIYVDPVAAGIGMLEFRLCGIMVENGGKWSVCFPFIGKEKLFTQELESQVKKKAIDEVENEPTSSDDLYPVTPSKKKVKKKNKK